MQPAVADGFASLPALIRSQRDALLAQWRREVRRLPSARDLEQPALDDHIPDLLDEIARALEVCSDRSIADMVLEGTPPAHGRQRLMNGFDVEEVVAEYNIVRGCLHDLCEAHGIRLGGRSFHVVNRVLDQAIGLAVQTYATQRALEVKRRRDEHVAFVAHDLRTPLQAIALATRMLDRTLADGARPEDTERLVRMLVRNVGRLDRLVDDVIKEHTEDPKADLVQLVRQEVDVRAIVDGTLEEVEPIAATGGTTLRNDVPVGLSAYADASVLRRVLDNLVANAIKYTPRGTVVVGARALGDGTVECWVRDDGAGVGDVVGDVFEKGVHDPQAIGFGLGLAIVKQCVQAHGGEVDVTSQDGIGTTFRFTLPGRPADG